MVAFSVVYMCHDSTIAEYTELALHRHLENTEPPCEFNVFSFR